MLTWHGAALEAAAIEASTEATKTTTEKAAEIAKSHHEWKSETGELEASIEAFPVEVKGLEVIGEWGSNSDHALYLEVGTVNMPARPYLRPAADAAYKEHEARIIEGFHGRTR